MMKPLRALALSAAVALTAMPAGSDEGMWTFDNVPTAAMQRAYRWAPDEEWLGRVQSASARLEGGCSGAIMSENGLVQTNHHCVASCVQDFSTPEADVMRTGFRAQARNEERRCPDFAIQVLQEITDVTPQIEAATAGTPSEGFARARDAEIGRLEGACNRGSRKCEVVTLYQGGQYKLYVYQRYDDVRLVFAPEVEAAFFGGDPDNFNFPRYCYDIAYLRLYENGAPARTPNHLTMREAPLVDGEMTLVAGNPGSTERLLTSSQLTFQRDVTLPTRIESLGALRASLIAFGAQGAQQQRMAAETLFSVENSLKALQGRQLALTRPAALASVARAESDLQSRVRRNAATQREIGPAWDEIAAATRGYRAFYAPYQLAEARAGGGSELFSWARDIVRVGYYAGRPATERLPRYSEARLPVTRAQVIAPTPIDKPVEEVLLAAWLTDLQNELGATNPLTIRILGGESPTGLAQRLVRTTRLNEVAERQRLWDGGALAVGASQDPLIAFVRDWDEAARALRLRYQREVEGPVARAQERIAQARFRAYGERVYPDATRTLRLSYGKVAGWNEPGGAAVPPFTNVAGLFARATGQAPYTLAPQWAAVRAQLPGDVIFNAVTTNDIIGGNSGSPVLDREGRVLGAVFDGNLHSLGGSYFYDGELNRTVMVANTVILLGLRNVYGMNALADELTGR
jgi:hypothetical protein